MYSYQFTAVSSSASSASPMTFRVPQGPVLFVYMYVMCVWEPGQLVGKSAGLVIERLRVRVAPGAAGEFSSPELTLCDDSYSVSVPLPCYRSGT